MSRSSEPDRVAPAGRAAGATPPAEPAGRPCRTLGLRDAIALIVGIVIGAGIFKAPSLVAANSSSEAYVYLAWALGGAVSLVGALCYAELATTYPHAGGDYHFLSRAFGRPVAFLFGWARFSVVTTGSIALLAFVFGDYMTQIAPLGAFSPSIWAAGAVLVLTWINARGVREGARAQSLLTSFEVGGLLLIVLAGVLAAAQGIAPAAAAAPALAATVAPFSASAFGFAMIFVLLTYGGWNEAAYISAELRGGTRNMVRALVWSILIITGLYLLVNWAYLAGLGLAGMAGSKAVAADLLEATFGRGGQWVISVLVAIAALTSMNATMIVGARTNYALGQDWPVLGRLAVWDQQRGTPVNALLLQGAFSMALVALGMATRGGFSTMVEYTAPVFWLFFLLSGASLFVLRHREPHVERPFRVPLYPLLPALFCAACAYMLWSSLTYVRSNRFLGLNAAWVGVGVLAVGMLLMLLAARVGARRAAVSDVAARNRPV